MKNGNKQRIIPVKGYTDVVVSTKRNVRTPEDKAFQHAERCDHKDLYRLTGHSRPGLAVAGTAEFFAQSISSVSAAVREFVADLDSSVWQLHIFFLLAVRSIAPG